MVADAKTRDDLLLAVCLTGKPLSLFYGRIMIEVVSDNDRISRAGKAVIAVATGEVWATAHKIILRSDGIGSCIVIAAYDRQKRIGALAHVMLPGKSTKKGFSCDTKYAQDAIEDMEFKMTRLGAGRDYLEACFVGAGNVLKDHDDKLCNANISSVSTILKEQGIREVARAVGGTTRRLAFLDIEDGAVYYEEDDGVLKLLHRWEI
jgi:chemotaxis protein CheD